jgi:hypothetical protein
VFLNFGKEEKMKKLFILLLLLGVAGSAWASNDWLTSATNSNWFDPCNWSGGYAPTRASLTNTRSYQTNMNTTYMPIISSGAAESYQLEVGGGSHATVGGIGTVTINGGTLTTGKPDNTAGGYFRAGASSTSNRWGAIYMNGGTVNVGGVEPFTVGWGSGTIDVRGWLYMTGGTINVTNQFNIANALGASGFAYLSGGTIDCNSFAMNVATGTHTGTALLDIIGSGKVTINGDVRTLVQGYIDNGWIKSNGVDIAYTDVTYNAGKTTIIPEPATLCLLGIGALSLLRRRK